MHPNQAEIDAAIKRRNDYFASLSPADRVKAEHYQAKLEAEAKRHPEGMMGVITDEVHHLRSQLLDALSETKLVADDHVSNLAAQVAIDHAKYKR